MHRKRLKDTLKPPLYQLVIYTNQKTQPTSTPHTNPPIQTAKDMNATRKDTMKEGEKKGSVGGRGAMEMGLEDSDNDQVFMDEVAKAEKRSEIDLKERQKRKELERQKEQERQK